MWPLYDLSEKKKKKVTDINMGNFQFFHSKPAYLHLNIKIIMIGQAELYKRTVDFQAEVRAGRTRGQNKGHFWGQNFACQIRDGQLIHCTSQKTE